MKFWYRFAWWHRHGILDFISFIDYSFTPLSHKLAPLKLLMTSEIQHWCSIPKGHEDRKIVVLLTWVNL